MKISYINPIWERRHVYGFPVRQYQTYIGNQIDETFGEIVLQRADGFIHRLNKTNIVSIDNNQVDFDIPQDVKVSVVGSKGDLYDVERVQGIERCSCPAFKFRKKCKHLEALAA